jgi:uncharacterized membrane protein
VDPRFLSDIYSLAVELALPLLGIVIILFSAGLIILRLLTREKVGSFGPFLFAFAILGGVAGAIAGASQEPIVGAMLTGLLGIVSALLAYLFSKESARDYHPVIPFAVILMVTSALGGLSIGGIRKTKFDNFDREFAIYKSELENLYYPVEKEIRLMRARATYGNGSQGR